MISVTIMLTQFISSANSPNAVNQETKIYSVIPNVLEASQGLQIYNILQSREYFDSITHLSV